MKIKLMVLLFSLFTVQVFAQGAGNAYQFNPSINCPITVPDNSTLDVSSGMTLEAWIYYTGGSNWQGIASKSYYSGGYSNSAFTLKFLENSGKLNFILFEYGNQSGYHYIDGSTVIPTNTWTHVAVKYTANGSMYIYINGVVDASGVAPASLPDSPQPFRIGTDQTGGGFPGTIDEVRFWNYERTERQIRENLYGTISPQSGLVGYWQFDESSGSTANDASGTGNHGSIDAGVTRVTSTLPFGTSVIQTVSTAANVSFTGTDLSANFSAKSGTDDFLSALFDNIPNGT